VRELAHMLVEFDLSELELEHAGMRIKLAKIRAQKSAYLDVETKLEPAKKDMPIIPLEETSPPPVEVGKMVSSPMVGTVYLSPKPGADPFVKVGDLVQEGQVLLIIEAMKIMNPIKSPFSGTIAKIFIHDAAPVEYGEVLFSVL